MGYNPSDEEMKEMSDEADLDKSGSIEFIEFIIMMAKRLKDIPTEAELRDAFAGKLFELNSPMRDLCCRC